LFFRTRENTLSSSALECGIVNISIATLDMQSAKSELTIRAFYVVNVVPK
jgi:hypothetical protein